jgi:hypothetical protein
MKPCIYVAEARSAPSLSPCWCIAVGVLHCLLQVLCRSCLCLATGTTGISGGHCPQRHGPAHLHISSWQQGYVYPARPAVKRPGSSWRLQGTTTGRAGGGSSSCIRRNSSQGLGVCCVQPLISRCEQTLIAASTTGGQLGSASAACI